MNIKNRVRSQREPCSGALISWMKMQLFSLRETKKVISYNKEEKAEFSRRPLVSSYSLIEVRDSASKITS